MRQYTSLSGFLVVQLTGADIPLLLEKLSKSGVSLFRVQQKDFLTVVVWVRRSDLNKLKHICERQGAKWTLLHRKGLYWIWSSVIRRPVFIIGIFLLLLLSWFLPTRILFVTVEGNSTVPTKLILEKAAQCGISFGADRRVVRSEKMKNYLLEAVPQLQWTGINTYGCTAVISVTERTEQEEALPKYSVSQIVADRDGIVYSCTVTKGTAVCVEGQAVRAGETLVSGYTDCGLKVQATRAEAEILAQTRRELTVQSPLDYAQKGESYRTERKISLILGKKRINFSKDSGISPTGCDKMYLEYYCVLPGGFQLPISIAVEQYDYRNTDSISVAADTSQLCVEDFALAYLSRQMLSGRVLHKSESGALGEVVYTLTGKYVCLEMIGRERSEEIIKHDG